MTARFYSATPVLRIFDEAKAREFYQEFLGFSVRFEHRFEKNFPLYMGIERDELKLDLTEHHGDACPGAAVRIRVGDVMALTKELHEKDYRFAKPGLPQEPTPWETYETTISDPFGNRLTFWSPA